MVWWKIYFWVYTVIMVLAIIGWLISLSSLIIGDWIGIALSIALYLGLYAWVFNKKSMLEKKWWATIFWVNVIFLVTGLLDFYVLKGAIENALPFLTSIYPVTDSIIIISTVIALPPLYATYLLGYPKGFSTKTKKK